MYLVHSPLFPQHRAYVLSFRVCAHWQNCHACVYLFSTFHCRACVYLGILPACVHLLPSIGLRACVWVYRLPAFICRLPLACMHCGVSPACVVFPLSIGVHALWCIACLRCFLPPSTGVPALWRIAYLCCFAASHWRAGQLAYTCFPFPIRVRTLVKLPACVCLITFGFYSHACIGQTAG